MRITRPLSFVVRQLTETIVRKTAIGGLAITMLITGVIAGQNLLVTPNSASAVTPPDACFAFDSGTGTITSYFSNENDDPLQPVCSKDVDIPSSVGGTPVTAIADYSFYSQELTAVTIPNSVTSIGEGVFENNSLSTVTIPSSVTTVGRFAFKYNQLVTAAFLGPVTTFGSNIFDRNILDSLTYDGTTYLDSSPADPACFIFASGTIGGYEYADMTLIKDNGIGCLSLDITIPSSISAIPVTSIGDSAFEGTGLTSVTIPNSVTSIGFGAFSSNFLTSVSIPNLLTSIEGYAFSNNQISSVTIPNSVTSIGFYSFSNNLLTSLTIPSSVTNIESYAFQDNKFNSLPLYFNTATTIPQGVFSRNEFTSLVIPGSVTSISEEAFGDNQLTSLTIPNSVTTIGDFAFSGNQLTSLTIPNSVTSIGYASFSHNRLTSLTLGNLLTSIDDEAFYGNSLASVIIPNSVTTIGTGAFGFQSASTEDIGFQIELGTQAEREAALESIWYVKLMTQDPSNIHNLKDDVLMYPYDESIGWTCDGECPQDFNGDGDTNDIIHANLGGHLINPASVTLSFANENGGQLQSDLTITGKLVDNTNLTNYFAIQGPVIPGFADYFDPTQEELDAQGQALQAYYRIGDNFTYTAPIINGVTPSPASVSFVLGATNQANNRAFVYGTSTSGGALANTGLSLNIVVMVAIAVTLAGGVGAVRYVKTAK